MTKPDHSPGSGDARLGGAGVPVVTAEMVEAGVDAYRSSGSRDRETVPDEEIVLEVFQAIANAATTLRS